MSKFCKLLSEKQSDTRVSLWLNICNFCRLNKDTPSLVLEILTCCKDMFETTKYIDHKHSVMCQMLSASQYLSRESAVDLLLKLFLNYSREDHITYDEQFLQGSFKFISKVGFVNIQESAVPFFRCILIKPSQHLKIQLCQGLLTLTLEEYHAQLVDFLVELSKDDLITVQKKALDCLAKLENEVSEGSNGNILEDEFQKLYTSFKTKKPKLKEKRRILNILKALIQHEKLKEALIENEVLTFCKVSFSTESSFGFQCELFDLLQHPRLSLVMEEVFAEIPHKQYNLLTKALNFTPGGLTKKPIRHSNHVYTKPYQ